MSLPMDEMLISVEIEQGSKLEELYNMLKDLQQAGGKIKLEIPDEEIEEIALPIRIVSERIKGLLEVLKSLTTKFPELIDELKKLADETLQEIKDFINDFVEWGNELKRDIFDRLKKILNDVAAVKKQTSKTITGELDTDLSNKVDDILKIITKNFADILAQLITVGNRISGYSGSIKRSGDKVIKEVVEEIQNLKSLISSEDINAIIESIMQLRVVYNKLVDVIQQNKQEYLKHLVATFERIFEVVTMFQQINMNTEQIRINIGELLKQKVENEDDLTKIKTALDFIKDKLARMHVDITNRATSMQLENIKAFTKHVKKQYDAFLAKMLAEYQSVQIDVSSIRLRINKIHLKKTRLREIVGKNIKDRLKEFKDELDQNLTGLIQPQLDNFLVSLTAELASTLEEKSGIKLPGIKRLEGTILISEATLDTFWRTLLSLLMTKTSEYLKENLAAYRGSFGRRFEGMKPEERDIVAKTLGFKIEEGESITATLEKVLDAIGRVGVMDLIKGMPYEKEVSETAQLIKEFGVISMQLRDIQPWSRMIKNDLDQTKKYAEDIYAKLVEEPAHEKIKRDKKGENM